jgi:hypothetical protein
MSTPTSESSPPSRSTERIDRFAAWWQRHDDAVYGVFCVACVVFAASQFYGYMLFQTKGVWSAPLDDVFIHFDYARSFARGFPFQWSEGNGYSSGNTSLTYPIALALGYWVGFRALNLAIWAAIVAVLSIVGFLFAAGRLVAPRGGASDGMRWVRFLFPPAVLSMGALDWTLFSGMENAFHLGTWALMLAATLWQTSALTRPQAMRRAWLAGATGIVLVATRPESAVCIAIFGFYAVIVTRQSTAKGWRDGLRLLVAYGLPAILTLLAHSVANLLFTGEWSANGAIAKLFVNNPFLTGSEMWDRYVSLLAFIIPRLLNHHFAELDPIGWMIPVLALVPLASHRTRRVAALLWVQAIAWLLLVALNNQLRWHNARYSMPTVSWLLLLAAMGIGVLCVRAPSIRFDKLQRLLLRAYPARVLGAVALLGLYWYGQAPRMRDQIWFYGRASRNILDQHITAGRLLDRMKVRRVLVGDAGALTYASDRPGLDLIGLGGYHAYPFARSTVHGLGASIELIERLPIGERPDVMAIYPSWWGDLPTLFGHYITSVPVRGNVICGGAEKVVYRADWDPLDRRGHPRTLREGEVVVDELDVADLLSEKSHDYRFPRPGKGFVRYRVLGDPADGRLDLFDAGRIIPPGFSEHAVVTIPADGARRLLLRVAPDRPMATEVHLAGKLVGTVEAEPKTGAWQEIAVELPPGVAGGPADLELRAKEGECVHYHVWILQR